MSISSSVYRESPLRVSTVAGPAGIARPLVWGHGWGQSGEALLPIAESLRLVTPSFVLDFPGFGKTPMPGQVWGTAEYSDHVATWIRSTLESPVLWVGHSFGGRVGIQLAARHPELVSGLVLIAAAGLQRHRSLPQRMRIGLRSALFQTVKKVVGEGETLNRLRQRMGSADYRAAGPLRPILSKVVREDLTESARQVQCPTLLLYGQLDTETPPEFGQRYSRLMAKSRYIEMPGLGHLTILTDGRHQVAARIKEFLQTLP